MRIADVRAFPISFPYPEDGQVALGIGRTVKRDAVLVKVVTDDGIVGWGEAHAGRSPGAIARIVETTLKALVLGMDAADVAGVGARIYRMQLASHGMGAGAAIAMSGLDMALWDIRGKAVGWPLYRLLGGAARAIPAYAGGISLGFQPPAELVEEAQAMVARGYNALKLRIGDTVQRDAERVAAVRHGLGRDVAILTDANTAYSLADARAVMPVLDEHRVSWLEEPFPAHDHRSYAEAKRYGTVPLAAGENHYTRYDFARLVEDRSITILQPDLSKCGGITEGLRIAALASAWRLPINPHTSVTGLNMAASVHFLAAIENGGYFEADASKLNPFRDRLCSAAFTLEVDGTVRPLEGPGLGVEIDEDFVAAHPVIDGPGYV
ncbi:mandelate racemase/muconate lactonizing enzyme family protein [Stella sp.]|uniref:mandelate racemase/muconate lactonizing enzyme family protein n=1 Tax=Stella sp. TaxID=2912054 RepID=UPI0035AF8425